MDEIKQLRQYLHRNPELSGQEYNTAQKIESFISPLSPTSIIRLGKTGRVFVFDSGNKGKTTMIRSELDGLPIQEINNIEYKSEVEGTAHLCGHDGHMAIVSGLAYELHKNPPEKGRVILLFQPAEETGEGAFEIIQDINFKDIEPDYIFALHNIPGEEKHKILYRENTFASASKGMTIKLTGKTSHAAEPEMGLSPVNAIADIIKGFEAIKDDASDQFSDTILLTIIHIKLGEIAFGTSPGYAEIRATLRAFSNSDLDRLTEKAESVIAYISNREGLTYDVTYSEIFPATTNSRECTEYILNAIDINRCNAQKLELPYKWSEDFGYYTEKYSGGFFGLGSGINQPALHNPDYDFPDDIIKTGIDMFREIINQINY
ncbi:MAG: amidohydrolase [Bacteroidales bacterium]|jgi:amidohydrolase|nr:amidohydrolase [Bacteroidales bacterium]